MKKLAMSILLIAAPAVAGATTITLAGTVRDFKGASEPGGHADFEDGISGVAPGIVADTLGADGKPVYATSPFYGATHGAAAFNQWYNDTPGVNLTAPLSLTLTEGPSGIFTYSSSAFFPIDGELFGNTPGQSHNFHFTLELHSNFTYVTGQTFDFTGDDDVWVFIDGTRVIDLGGVHAEASQSVALDTLGLTAGNTYNFDLFFAERHTVASDFKLQTSIVLVPTPEPGSLLLMGAGLAGLAALRRGTSRA